MISRTRQPLRLGARLVNVAGDQHYVQAGESEDAVALASGEQCGDTACHSAKSQSSIYIDNFSAGFTINDNVIVNTANTLNGWLFFQWAGGPTGGPGCRAHDNTAHGNTICNSGPPSQSRDPLDEVNGPNVTGTVNVSDCSRLPLVAGAVVVAAGPRKVNVDFNYLFN